MKMPCSNTTAERQHDRSESDAESLHDSYGERVIQDVVDRLEDGHKVCGNTIHDFMPELAIDDCASLVYSDSDYTETVKDRIKLQTRRAIRDWCDNAGADYVAEKVREWAQDDADSARGRDE